MDINLKCIVCGEEFTSSKVEEVKCPKCGRTFSFDRASKYYKSFNKIREEEKKIAIGETYIKVDSILNEANFYLENEDFDMAKDKFMEALDLTNVDVRVYMGLVKAYTKNFTDTDDNEHIPYFNKAIELSDYNEKKELKKIYMPFYLKRNMTEDEIKAKKKEEEAANKARLEKVLKDGIPKHFGLEKIIKVKKIIIPIVAVIDIVCVVLTLALDSAIAENIFSIIGIAGVLGVCLLIVSLINNIKIVNLFNFVLDFYDNYGKFEFDEREIHEVNKMLEKIGISYVNGESAMTIESKVSDFVNVLTGYGNNMFDAFASKYKVVSKMVN